MHESRDGIRWQHRVLELGDLCIQKSYVQKHPAMFSVDRTESCGARTQDVSWGTICQMKEGGYRVIAAL